MSQTSTNWTLVGVTALYLNKMKEKLIKEEYIGLDGGAFGLEEIAAVWIQTFEREDGTRYEKRTLRSESYSINKNKLVE